MATQTSFVDEATIFEALCQHIEAVVGKKRTQKLSKGAAEMLKDNLKIIRHSQKPISVAVIIRIVSLVDVQEHCCSRLEPAVFILTLETVLQAGYSQQKERGIYLLAESIHYDCHKRSKSRAVEARRGSIGKSCIHKLISCFTDVNENARVRRWIGALILPLLGSDATRLSFEAGPEDNKRKLGSMVVEEGNEILRIICGQILKVLLTWDIALKDLWPINADPKLYAEFPLSSQKDKHRSNAFQSYADQLFNGLDPSPNVTGRLYFVQAVIASPHELRFSGCTISIFINGEVSVCKQPYDESFMECLDIPLDLITNLEVANTTFETDHDDGSEKAYGKIKEAVDLVFTLTNPENSTCYVNAAAAGIRQVKLTISNEDLADDIGSEILNEIEIFGKEKGLKISQSKDVIVVNQTSNEKSPQSDLSIIKNNLIVAKNLDFELGIINNLEKIGAPSGQLYCSNSETTSFPPFPVKDSVVEEEVRYVNPKDICCPINKIAETIYETMSPSQMLNMASSQHLQLDIKDEYAQQLPVDNPGLDSAGDAWNTIDRVIDTAQNDDQNFVQDYEEAQHIGYGENIVLPPPSTPTRTGLYHEAEALKFLEKSHNMSASLTKSRHKKGSLVEVKEQKAMKVPSKSNGVAPKIASQRRKKSGRISKNPSRKPNTTFYRDSSKPIFNSKAKLVDTQLPKGNTSEGKFLAKDVCQPPPPGISQKKKVAKGTKMTEEVLSEPTITKKEQGLSKHAHGMGFTVANTTLVERFSSQLGAALSGLDDTDQPNTIKRQGLTDNFARQNQANPVVAEIETSTSSAHQHPRSEEVTTLPKQLPAKERKTRQWYPSQLVRRSPRLISPTKAAAVALNQVLVSKSTLFNDKMARKTPIVGFGNKGPLNQGLGSAEILLTVRSTEAKKTTVNPVLVEKQESVRGGKRKRVAEGMLEREETGQQQISDSQIITSSHSKRALPLAFQHEQEPVLANTSSSEKNIIVLGSQRSCVDENGSPHVSGSNYQQRVNFRVVAKKVARVLPTYRRTEAKEGDGLNHGVDDCSLPLSQGGSQQVLASIPLKPSLEPNNQQALSLVPIEKVTRYIGRKKPVSEDLRGTAEKESLVQHLISGNPKENRPLPILVEENAAQYVPYKRVTECKSPKAQQEQGRVCHAVLPDPFLGNRSKGNPTHFTRQLEKSSKERLSYEPTAGPPRAIPQKRKAGVFDDQEVTLVNIRNRPSQEGISSPSDMTDNSSDEYQDLEQQLSTVSYDLTIDDEWKMALQSHQKGVLEALYQISNDLVRYLISHEEAITDVLNDYLRGGSRLINEHDLNREAVRLRTHQELEEAKNKLRDSLTDSRQQVLNRIPDSTTLNLSDLEKAWKEDNDILERMADEARRPCG